MEGIWDRKNLDLVARAGERLKQAGFRHVGTSMQSEACYYALADRQDVLRVAAHRYSRRADKLVAQPISACLTFSHRADMTEAQFETMLAMAAGRYIMSRGQGVARWRKSRLWGGEDNQLPLMVG